MRSRFFLPALAVSFLLAPSLASAASYEYTTFAALEAVNDDGTSNYSGSGSISLIGVIINNPLDMLDGVKQWQTYVQALPAGTYGGYTVASGDYGGAAMYMANWGNYYNSSTVEWSTELNRLTSNGALKYGDVVRVTAGYPGETYNGKFNINEGMHAGGAVADTARDYNIEILGNTTPTAANITLADLKDSNNRFIFDQNRKTGCEHYQASLVHLDGLTLDSSSTWATNGTVVVHQGDRTFNMKLGLDSDLMSTETLAKLTSTFSITAILDQEETDGGAAATAANLKQVDGYTGEYRLWLTDAGMLTVPEPSSFLLLVVGLIGMAAYACRKWK